MGGDSERKDKSESGGKTRVGGVVTLRGKTRKGGVVTLRGKTRVGGW